MKVIKLECPNCKAILKIDYENKKGYCEHCGTVVLIDDEIQHIQYDNAEEAGYSFEKGRQKAQEEKEKEEQRAEKERIERNIAQQRAYEYQRQKEEEEKKKNARKGCLVSTVFMMIVVVVIICSCGSCFKSCGGASSSDNIVSIIKDSDDSTIWAKEYAGIEDFEYSLVDDEMTLTGYKSMKKKVRINPTYIIDGKERRVVELKGTFALESVSSVIVPEGVKKISGNTFNSTGIEYLYLPSTLEEVDGTFWHYFHGTNKIYFGGTEEQWKSICDVDRGDISVTEIIYNANINELNN